MAGPFILAHRGLSAEHPENTEKAMVAARAAGFAGLEMDLRVTRDHEVVVLHDEGVERTTNGSGRVADMRYDELRSYDTGAGPVPRLDSLFAALDDWTGLWNLEIKANQAVVPMLELIEHHEVGSRVVVTSMDPSALALVAQHAPLQPRGLIVLGPPDDDDFAMAKELEATWLMVDHMWLDEDMMEEIEEHQFRVGAWTVNDPDRAKELSKLGVECIITDVRAVLEALKPEAPAEPWF